ncbi:hypothetical protein SpCBS45565_g01090 [Spizellomyces sp. 'palustris']|nr:hypothetical protein SpCBS45565_g01090 [Spizellomyces sp. 'palustris']
MGERTVTRKGTPLSSMPIITAATSNLPPPPPPLSLPPKVVGPVRYFLSVTVSKLVWTNPPSPERTSSTASLPRVRLQWWGEDGPGIIFSPQSIGGRTRMSPSKPSSSIPVPPIRAKTWSSPVTVTSSPGRNTVHYPVRCSKRQLRAYFRDMGSLVLLVIVDDRVAAEVKVHDLSILVSEPSKPINGFFPVVEKSPSKSDFFTDKEQPRKLGELHLAMMLETVLPNYDGSGQPKLNRHHTQAPRGIFDLGNEQDDISLLQHQPREPPGPPTDRNHTENIILLPSAETTGSSVLPEPPLSLKHLDEAEAEVIADSHRASTNIEGLWVVSPTDASGEVKGMDARREIQPHDQGEGRSLTSSCDDRSIPIHEKEVLQPQISTGGKPQTPLNMVDVTNIPESPDANEADVLLALGDELDDADDLDTISAEVAGLLADDDGFLPDSVDIEEYESDLFDDDLIIEALNSASGKSFIERRARESSSENLHNGNLERETRTEETFSSDSEDEASDMSDDERKRRALFDRNWKNQTRKSAIFVGRGNHVQNDLSVNKLTSLGRVDYVMITIRGLELVPDVLPHASATYFVKYRLPGTGTDATVSAFSKTVPRLTVSRNASRRSLVESDDPPMYVSEFDHQQRFPYTFNSTTIELWNMQDIEFQVVAERKSFFAPSSRNATVPHQKLWTAAGILKCDDVLNATNFTWSGKIPIWSSETGGVGGKRKPMISNIGKRRSSQRDHRHLIGYLIAKVQLASDRATLSKPDGERASYTSASHRQTPEKPDDEMEPVQDLDPRSIHDGESQLPPVTPYYLHLHISTARSLSILPTFEGNSTLLYLVIRLFSSATPPIETPPISYSPPFDLTNGRLNAPPNFAFSYTLPLAVTQEFIGSHRETPLIVEVWVIDGDSLKSPSMLNARSALADHTDRGAKLLGLMRLPFHHLLGTMAATLKQNQIASFPGQDMPVMIPEAEYVVMDPFSGTSKGWIRSFLALGNWDQIKRVRKVSRASEIADDEDLAEVQMARKRQAGRVQDSRRSRRRDAAKTRPRHVTVETDSPDSPIITAEDVSQNDIPTECQIEISIHRACGLRALVSRLIAAQSSKYIQEYTPLDFAKEIGPNSYVRLQPFSERVQVITNQDSDEDEGFDDGATIISPIVAQTFTPEYEHTATLTIRGVDTDLLRWIRKGGEARGEIWHHVPGEVTDQEDGEDFLLGTFRLPLGALLSRPNGIDGTWVPVRFERSDPVKVEAAIKLSMRFRTGFEFGHVVEGAVNATRGLGWWSRLKVDVLHLNHLDIVKQYWQQKGNFTETQATRQLYVRWRYPVPAKDERGLRIEEEESLALASNSADHPDRLTTVEMSCNKSVDIEMTQAVIRWFREREFEIEVRQRGEEGEGDTLIGTAYIDLHDLVSKARHSQRRRGRQMTRTRSDAEWLVEGSFPLINPKSPDLMGASVAVRISMSPVSPPRVRDIPPISKSSAQLPSSQGIGRSPQGRMTDIGARGQLSPGGSQHQPPGVPVEITVERALHLPLMADPFAEYLASPFVSQNEKQTVLPNAYVTFDWSGSDKQEELSGQTLRTHVATAQRSPTWNFTVSVPQERSEKALKMLKYEKAVIFRVWHAPNINVGRQHAGRDKPEIDDETRSELLGTARVDLGSLFGGLKEIYGWYHILDGRGVSKGQLLIKVHPLENVGAVLRELTGYQEKRHSSRGVKASGRRPLEAACGKAADDVTPVGIATFVRQIPTGESSSASAGLYSSSLDSAAVTNPSKVGQSVDTWVWTGHKWEHRQVEVRAVDAAEGVVAQGSDRAKMSPDNNRNAFEERSEGNLRSSLQKSMEELEELNKKLKEKTSDTSLTKVIQQNDVEREVADFEPDRSLPADEGSPSWQAHPTFGDDETPSHPASVKSGYQSGNSSTACRGLDQSKAQVLASDVPFSDAASFPFEEKEELRLSHLNTPSKEASTPLEAIAQSHIDSTEKAQLVRDETSSLMDTMNKQPVMHEEAYIAQEINGHEQDDLEHDNSWHVSPQNVEGNHANDASSGFVEASAVGDTNKVLPSDGGTTIAEVGYEVHGTTLAWTTLAKRLDAVEAAATQDDYGDDFDMLDTAEADVNAEDVKYDETIAVDEQLANSIVTSTVSENDHEDIKVRLPKDHEKDDATDEYQSPSLLPPDLRGHQRVSLGRDEEKENIGMVPNEDNNETDDDDIYSILAYRRMAAAAAAVGVSKASSSGSRGRTIVASVLEEAAQKPPRLPASARSSKAYDPFGVRNRETRITWKAAVDSDTSVDEEAGATWTRGERRGVEHEGRDTRNWRAVLGGKTGAVDKARVDTMEKIFWAGKEKAAQ